MTCARRPAGAQRPAPSTPAGSESRTASSPGRARCSFLVSCFALLLGALGPLVAAPAQAQSVWSATLTVTAPDGDLGCFGNTGANGCNTAFDNWAFTHDSTGYNVYGLIVSENQVGHRHLDLLLSKKIPDALKGLMLCVGTTGYALSNGTISDDEPANDDNAVRWRIASGALGWSAGDEVSVSLASSCEVPVVDVVLDAADFLPISDGVAEKWREYYELIVPANGSATFGVKLSAAPARNATVVLTKTIGLHSHHHDVNAATVSPATLTFTPGNYNDAQTVTVTGVPDRVSGHEHLVIVVVNSDSESGSAGAVKSVFVTVTDDTAVKVGAWPAKGSETGDGSARNADVTVWLNKAATGQVTVNYATQDGSATAGSDYTAVSGTVTFAAGETRKTVQVPILDDSAEDSGETFYLVLANPSGASLNPDYARAVIEILNDEAHPDGLSAGAPGSGFGGGSARTAPGFADDAAAFAIAEIHAAEAVVGTVTATDRDGDELTYSLASDGEDHEAFAIDTEGAIRVAAGMMLDFEAQAAYAFTVQVSDGEDAGGEKEDNPTADDTIAVTVTVENVEEPPGPPAELTVRDAGPFALAVDWTAPVDTGAGLNGYAVQYRPNGAETWTDLAHAGTATAAAIGGLTPDARYEVRVRALGDGNGEWTAATGRTAPLDESAAREHLFPLFADGDGFHSRLYLTGVSGAGNHCTLELRGPGLDAVRFEASAETSAAPASGAEIALGEIAVVRKTAGADALAFGYAKLSCAEQAVARLLLSWESGGAPAAMTSLESVAPEREFRFLALARLGLVFSNDGELEAACAVEAETAAGASAGGGNIAVPAGATAFGFLDELAALAEDVDGGAVSVNCDRPVAALAVPLDGGVFAALAAESPADGDAASSRQVLPLVLDGGGFRSRLLLTNRSGEVNWCQIGLRGSGLTADRFADAAGVIRAGSGIYPKLAADGGRISLSSLGGETLAFGHVVVECDGPVEARNVIAVQTPEGRLAGMAAVAPVQPARDARFPVAPGLGLGLALTNAADTAASCRAELAPAGREETLAATPVRVAGESTAVRFLGDLFELPADFAGGDVKLSCDRDIAAVALIHAPAALEAGTAGSFPDTLPFALMPPVVTAADATPDAVEE